MRTTTLYKSITGLALLAGAVALMTACSSSTDTPNSEDPAGTSSAPDKITLLESSPKGIGWSVELIAQAKGYFSGQNLEVDLQSGGGGSETAQQIIAGNFDYGLPNAATAIIGSTKEPSLRVLGCQNQKNVFSIITLADSGISQFSDLAGKAIGITDQASGEVPLVKAALKRDGITDKVKLLTIGSGPAAILAIKNGTVAAYAGGLSDMVPIKASKLDTRSITPPDFANLASHCLTTRGDVIDSKHGSDITLRLMTALQEATAFMMNNKDEALQTVCKESPQSCKSQESAKLYFDSVIELTQPLNSSEHFWGIDQDAWDQTVNYLGISGSIDPSKVNLKQLINDPKAVALYNKAVKGA